MDFDIRELNHIHVYFISALIGSVLLCVIAKIDNKGLGSFVLVIFAWIPMLNVIVILIFIFLICATIIISTSMYIAELILYLYYILKDRFSKSD